jgi:hypothetical protein
MSRRRNNGNWFIELTIKSLGVFVIIVALMIVFAKIFGELAIPAINMMSPMLYIPIATLVIGIFGWIFLRHSDH